MANQTLLMRKYCTPLLPPVALSAPLVGKDETPPPLHLEEATMDLNGLAGVDG